MAISKCDVIFKLFLIYFCVGLGSSLTLSSLTTRKPKEIKTVPTNNTELPGAIENQLNTELQRTTTEKSTTVLYRLLSSNGATCILLKTDGLITITYKDKLGEDVEHSEYIADNPEITGECIEQDTSWMKLSWTGFSLDFRFYKTPGGERWYVDKVELKFRTDNNKFDLLGDKRNKEYRLTTNPHHSAMLFPTPVGKSFACDKETAIKLRQPENKTPKLSGVLLLRDLRLQPFMYKSEDFGTPFQCSDIMGFRDETAPIAVGSTLAIAVLGTITGYGIFRYFKIKKVQYDTME